MNGSLGSECDTLALAELFRPVRAYRQLDSLRRYLATSRAMLQSGHPIWIIGGWP